jgi:hypothetical protein
MAIKCFLFEHNYKKIEKKDNAYIQYCKKCGIAKIYPQRKFCNHKYEYQTTIINKDWNMNSKPLLSETAVFLCSKCGDTFTE